MRTKDIPVIFISAMSDTVDKVKGFQAGGVDYITKPFQREEVIVRVALHLKLKNSRDELKKINQELNIEVKERQRTEELLRAANKKIEEKIKHITESIQYAKMIQRSLLPNPDEIRSFLPESFIIWMPRDIVSGDIYFAEFFPSAAEKEKGDIVIAVIDCTGHGIPGAFMTMIASSALRRIIKDDGCLNPAEILKRLNFIVKTTLQQETVYASSDDGMDAAIVRIQHIGRDINPTLTFAGAKLPLVYIQNNNICVIKGDRQSIGYKRSKRSDINFDFTNHIIHIEKGIAFYLFSDGFADQLGGKDDRRFGNKQFYELLKENADLSFEKQQEIIIQRFNEHKGDYESLDDITIMGFRF